MSSLMLRPPSVLSLSNVLGHETSSVVVMRLTLETLKCVIHNLLCVQTH